ncbi:MAG: hypothetical protein V8Q57_08845 [Blautia sp.]
MIMTAPRTIARTTARTTAVLPAQKRIPEAVGILQGVTRSPIHPRTPEMAVQTFRIIQKIHLRTMETKMIPAGIIPGEDTEGDTWSDDTGSDSYGETDPDMVVYE